MATPNHTAPSRVSGISDHLRTHLPGVAPDSLDTGEPSPPDIDHLIACIFEANTVINCLLADSDAYCEAIDSGLDVRPDQWPLTPVTCAGLLVASELLDQFAERLMHEPMG